VPQKRREKSLENAVCWNKRKNLSTFSFIDCSAEGLSLLFLLMLLLLLLLLLLLSFCGSIFDKYMLLLVTLKLCGKKWPFWRVI
jgi:hypothetical protein